MNTFSRYTEFFRVRGTIFCFVFLIRRPYRVHTCDGVRCIQSCISFAQHMLANFLHKTHELQKEFNQNRVDDHHARTHNET
jgi:hypothetical protein